MAADGVHLMSSQVDLPEILLVGKHGMQMLYDSLPKKLDRLLHILIYHHCWELMKSVGSHGSSSLLFRMKKVQGHISSKRPIYDIVFNEEFISKPLTKCWSGNRWTNV